MAIEEGTADDWRNFATALVASMPEGRFPTDAEFLAALDKLEALEAGDPMVLFYRGGAAREIGDRARAVELWSLLLEQVPQEAPARKTLEALIAETMAPPP
jgi:cytochrome c-type biogenesis protein CcmH/NrfG